MGLGLADTAFKYFNSTSKFQKKKEQIEIWQLHQESNPSQQLFRLFCQILNNIALHSIRKATEPVVRG